MTFTQLDRVTFDGVNTEHLFHLALRCATTPGNYDEDVSLIVRASRHVLELRAAMISVDSMAREHPDDERLQAAFVLLLGAVVASDHVPTGIETNARR